MFGQSNLKYMPALSFYAHFVFTFCLCCAWGSRDIVINHCYSQDLFQQPGFYLLLKCFGFFFVFFYFNSDVKFCPTDWKQGISNENQQLNNGDPLYGQTLCHTWVAKPRHRCIVSSPWFYLSLGWWHEMYVTNASWFRCSVQSIKQWKEEKKCLKRWCGDRQIMKRDCISLKVSVFFGTLPLQHNLY